ncbi:hypothetical protein ACIRD8_09095 [Streptomyces sp. NPDC102451]|uniref:hypothetical protein n=1 Tax=Streptomyces sp. NPDC102451 TaxID=3366177 RepID=UPI00382CE494
MAFSVTTVPSGARSGTAIRRGLLRGVAVVGSAGRVWSGGSDGVEAGSAEAEADADAEAVVGPDGPAGPAADAVGGDESPPDIATAAMTAATIVAAAVITAAVTCWRPPWGVGG